MTATLTKTEASLLANLKRKLVVLVKSLDTIGSHPKYQDACARDVVAALTRLHTYRDREAARQLPFMED